jgi:hypothetical protein
MAINKLKKTKKKLGNLGLGAFPVIKEDTTIANFVKNVSRRKNRAYGENGVPRIPNSFYENAAHKNDNLMAELNKLNEPENSEKQNEIAKYLVGLEAQIKADKTWFAINQNNEASFTVTDSSGIQTNKLSAANEIISHAMSIDHLMLVKNKMYIDNLINNDKDLTSLFIVPINERNSHGMLLAGYKTGPSDIDNIVVALDKSKVQLKSFI